MLSKFIAVSSLFCFAVLSTFAQKVTVAEPEFINSALVIKGKEGVKLEKQIPFEKARRTVGGYALGVSGGKVLKQVKGTASTIRIEKGEGTTFIVRTSSNQYDPADEIAIIKLKVTAANRTYELASTDIIGQSKEGDITYVPFDGKKYGESSYMLVVSVPLEPGEYAIALRHASDVLNCFGVD
jgi:hypothetical protein